MIEIEKITTDLLNVVRDFIETTSVFSKQSAIKIDLAFEAFNHSLSFGSVDVSMWTVVLKVLSLRLPHLERQLSYGDIFGVRSLRGKATRDVVVREVFAILVDRTLELQPIIVEHFEKGQPTVEYLLATALTRAKNVLFAICKVYLFRLVFLVPFQNPVEA